MSAYTAPTITDASALSSAEINSALDHDSTGLGEAINGAIDINNISVSKTLKAKHVQPNTVTEALDAKPLVADVETLSVVLSGEPFGEHTNIYSPTDCAKRITTTATADIAVSAFFDLHKVKHEWTSISDLTITLTATLSLNDTTLRQVDVEWSVASADEHRSIPIRLDGLSASAPAGTYDAWLKLDFSGSSGTGGTVPDIVQFYGTGRGIRVEAFYT